MTRSLAVAAGLVVLGAPPTASAASLDITPAKRCYSSGESVNLMGTGFSPLGSASVTRDGTPLGALQTDANGYLLRIVEKPKDLPPQDGKQKPQAVSMNCWRFDARIFAACREVPRSARGEFELPGAVTLAMSRGVRFRALPAQGPVLDLSRRADMLDVARRLETASPRP